MPDIVVRISGASDKYLSELNKVRKETRSLEQELKNVARVSGLAFAALSGTAALAVKSFAEFDNSLRSVKTLLNENSFGAKALDQGFKEMKTDLLAVAGAFPVSLGALNKALFDTVSAGVDASKAVKTVGVAAKLATAGVTDVAIATDGLTSALNAYGLEAEQADAVAAKFFLAQKSGKTTVEELSRSFGLVASTAKNTGVSLDELLSAVSAATVGSIKTNQAFTGLQAVIANIVKPSQEAEKEARRLGVAFNGTELRAKGLEGFLNSLTQSSKFTKDSVTKLFGSMEAARVAFALTGEQAGDFKKILGELKDETKGLNTFNAAATEQTSSLASQMGILKNNFERAAIAIGEQLAPAVEAAATATSKLLKLFAENEAIGTTVGLLLAAGVAVTGLTAAISTAALIFIKLKAVLLAANVAVAALTGGVLTLAGATGIGLLIAAVGLLVYKWDEAWPIIKGTFVGVVKTIMNLGGGLKDFLVGIFTLDTDKMKEGNDKFVEALRYSFDTVKEEIKRAQEEFKQATLDGERDTASQSLAEKLEADRKKEEILKQEAARRREEQIALAKLQQEEDLIRMVEDEEARKVLRQSLSQGEKDELLGTLDTKKTAEEKYQKERLKQQIAKNNEFLKNEAQWGKEIAMIDRALTSERVEAWGKASGEMVQLTQSGNAELKAIGKAFAVSQIAIDSATSAVSVAKSVFAALPFPINIPAAAIAAAGRLAFGAEQASRVIAAKKGGIIPGQLGIPGRDSVPVMAQPGELFVPPNSANDVIQAAAAKMLSEQGFVKKDEEASGRFMVDIGFRSDEASRVLSVERNKQQSLGIFTGA